MIIVKDSETQRNLEMLHRDEEDALYRQFSRKRAEEVSNINTEIKEEWEKELEKLTSKFLYEINSKKKRITTDEEKALTLRHQKEKEDLEKNMTIKLDRKKESLTKKLLELERQATAELVEKQSKEMMNLITAKLQEFSLSKSSSTTIKENGDRTEQLVASQNNAGKAKDSNRISTKDKKVSRKTWSDFIDLICILDSFSIFTSSPRRSNHTIQLVLHHKNHHHHHLRRLRFHHHH